MDKNPTTIMMVAACLSFLGGCESQDVAKQAIIILARSSTLPSEKSNKAKLEKMSSDEIFYDYSNDTQNYTGAFYGKKSQ